jgi:tetratricopeptide (TPR) repeat protein
VNVRTVRGGAVLLFTALAAPLPLAAQQQQATNRWAEPKCDLKPNDRLVNQGVLFLKSATTGKFADQKKKDLADAQRVLTQALTTGGQDKNPAAWYYLARYYVMTEDGAGIDSAFTRAQALKPDCKSDIDIWRRFVWVPTFNAGIAAWQANNVDSAIASFRRASAMLPGEPTGLKYLATLYYNTGKSDTALIYFRRAADAAAADPKFAQDRKDALFNLGRIQQSLQQLAEAEKTYHEYLALYPNDAEIMAALGGVYMQKAAKDSTYRDSAFTIYRQIIGKGDSMGYFQLYRVGAEISGGVPEDPDTAVAGGTCRRDSRAKRPPLTPARIRAHCDSVTSGIAKAYHANSHEAFSLAAQALDASLKINPYYRETLIYRANTALGLHDSVTALAASRRLLAIDPMNRTGIKIMAFAQQQNGRVDSALYYYRLGDSLLVGDVAVSQFDSTDTGREVRGVVTNTREAPNPPYKLIFEFVDLKGAVVATDTVVVAATPPGQSQQFALKPAGPTIAAWRYKKQ